MGRRLTLDQRKVIQKELKKNTPKREIAKILDIYPSTVHREVKKCPGKYNALLADKNTSKGYHVIDFSIIGKKINLLTIIEMVGYNTNKRRRTIWKCRCECGAISYFSRKMLMDRCSKRRPLSCGCIPKQSKGPNGDVPFKEAVLRKYEDLLKFRKIKGSCWEWTGYRHKLKCPKTSWKNKGMSVRKCMYLLMNDITFEPNPVFTTCGNLLCFNPDHITLERPVPRHFYED